MSFINFCDRCGNTYSSKFHVCDNQNITDYEIEYLEDPEDEFDIDELLITEVAKRPALFDCRLPVAQRSRLKIQELWTEIHNELKDFMSLEELKKRWRTIRDRYIRTKNTKYLPSGSAGTSTPNINKYKYGALLKFLDDTIAKKKTVSNVGFLSGDSSRSSTQETSASPISRPNTPSSSSALKRKRNVSSELESELLNKLREPGPLKQEDKMDDVDHFCASLATGLRKLEYRARLKLQIQYLQLLDEQLEIAE